MAGRRSRRRRDGAVSASPATASSSGTPTAPGVRRAINIFKIQPNPETQPPVQVGEIPALPKAIRDSTIASSARSSTRRRKGQDRYLMVRNAGTNTIGRMESFQIDTNTCLPMAASEVHDFHAQSHEFYLWHDPANPNRVLVYMTNWTGGVPDPDGPASGSRPARAGHHRRDNRRRAGEGEAAGRLHPAGCRRAADRRAPRRHRTLFRRTVPDFSDSKNRLGQAGNLQNREQNRLHSVSVTDDGERVYVAGTTAGFYVLDSEAIASSPTRAWPPARPVAISARRSCRPAADRRRRACRRSRTTACTWSSTTIRA